MRRTVDILVAVVAGIALLPLFFVLALTILTVMGNPVLFRQARPGLHNVPFVILKFSTMRAPRYAGEPDHERTTRLGAVLRATSLDELPQLWNILRGHMSFIGPRPLPIRPKESYTSAERARLVIRPGLTGWAQVNGRNALRPQERTELDIWYICNRSLSLDLKILFLTVVRGLSAQGVHGPLEPHKTGTASHVPGDTEIAGVAERSSEAAGSRELERGQT
ncbi:sugar transferase [Saccharopolyspora shandongensis]|uniref:sugar transferase n=1 Tax=Saccharopolyspora shandongensis TaxID=418495 RepID=UPI0033EE9E59